jgi:hypothetical protein
VTEAHEELSAKVAALGVPPLEAQILEELAKEPDGMPFGEARLGLEAVMTAPDTECYLAIAKLQKAGYLILHDESGFLSVNFEAIGLDPDTQRAVLVPRESYTPIGTPVSERAVETLEELFQSDAPLFLVLEMTGRHLFPALPDRARSGRPTVFVYPARKLLPAHKLDGYDRALEEWRDYIKNGDPSLRKHVRICIAQTPIEHLYLSVLSRTRLRYTLYTYDSGVRYGELVEASVGTSLYQTVDDHFRRVVRQARPLWRLWKKDWIRVALAARLGLLGGLVLAITLTLVGGSVGLLAAAIVASVVANHLYEILQRRRGKLPSLFKSKGE